jgi:hypothetical protein
MKTYQQRLLIPALAILGLVSTLTLNAQTSPGQVDTASQPGTQMFDRQPLEKIYIEGDVWNTGMFRVPLTNEINFSALPVTEVGKTLQENAYNAFDILLPNATDDIQIDNISTTMRLRRVSIIEVFQAMNLQFQLNGDSTPVRWELIMNGDRPTAVLRIIPRKSAKDALADAKPSAYAKTGVKTSIIYIGNLMTHEALTTPPAELNKISNEIIDMTRALLAAQNIPMVQFTSYSSGELLVAYYTSNEQLDTVRQVIQALQTKAQAGKRRQIESNIPSPTQPDLAIPAAPKAPAPVPALAPDLAAPMSPTAPGK